MPASWSPTGSLADWCDSPYFGRYQRSTSQWQMAVGEVDGEPAIVVLSRDNDGWKPRSIARLHLADDFIVRIVDYWHCPWILPEAAAVTYLDPC